MLKRIVNLKREAECHDATVVDAEATASAISSCESAAQARIDQYQAEIDECNEQIENYNNLIDDINSRKNTASAMIDSYNDAQQAADLANLNCDLNLCVECLTTLGKTFDSMIDDCNSKITEYEDKRTKAEENLEQAKNDKVECASIVITKTVTVCE